MTITHLVTSKTSTKVGNGERHGQKGHLSDSEEMLKTGIATTNGNCDWLQLKPMREEQNTQKKLSHLVGSFASVISTVLLDVRDFQERFFVLIGVFHRSVQTGRSPLPGHTECVKLTEKRLEVFLCPHTFTFTTGASGNVHPSHIDFKDV